MKTNLQDFAHELYLGPLVPSELELSVGSNLVSSLRKVRDLVTLVSERRELVDTLRPE